MFRHLFADKRSYVRGFIAEAFAFLFRKCRGENLNKLLEHVVQTIRNAESSSVYFQQGIAQLLFEAIRVRSSIVLVTEEA